MGEPQFPHLKSSQKKKILPRGKVGQELGKGIRVVGRDIIIINIMMVTADCLWALNEWAQLFSTQFLFTAILCHEPHLTRRETEAQRPKATRPRTPVTRSAHNKVFSAGCFRHPHHSCVIPSPHSGETEAPSEPRNNLCHAARGGQGWTPEPWDATQYLARPGALGRGWVSAAVPSGNNRKLSRGTCPVSTLTSSKITASVIVTANATERHRALV